MSASNTCSQGQSLDVRSIETTAGDRMPNAGITFEHARWNAVVCVRLGAERRYVEAVASMRQQLRGRWASRDCAAGGHKAVTGSSCLSHTRASARLGAIEANVLRR